MRTAFRKTAYLFLLVAMTLLLGEKVVPHHHCVGVWAECCADIESVHFGYGDCEDCDGHDAGHAHDEEHCCEDTPLYLRASGSDVHVEKRYLVSNDSFIIPQQPVLPVNDAVADCILLWHLKIPDVRVPYHALRAPPVV